MTKYLNHYSDLRQGGLREKARGYLLSTAGGLLRAVNSRLGLLERPRVQFVYLHYVFDDQLEAFRRIVGALARSHRLISYSEGVQRVRQGKIDAPYLCFSFDDGLKNCLQAARILEDFSVTACFFVCPKVLEASDEAERQAFAHDRLNMPSVEFMSWQDLYDLKRRGHEIGAHTINHFRLSDLSQRRLENEIGYCAETMRRRLGDVKHFAWPYGRFEHFSEKAAQVAFKTGFVSCASAERGCHVTGVSADQELCIRRDHIVASWPLSHVLTFLAVNVMLSDRQENGWPDSWNVEN